MENAGCCLVVILGLLLWLFFMALVGALPALGFVVAYMLWASGQRDFVVLAIIVSSVSAYASFVFFSWGYSNPGSLTGRDVPPIHFIASQIALPLTLIMSLVILRIRRNYHAPEINTSINVITVICAVVVLVFYLLKAGSSGDYSWLWAR